MAVLPLPPPPDRPTPLQLDDFRDNEVTVSETPPTSQQRAQRLADVAAAASRVESLISMTFQAYDDMSSGRTSDLPRKSQRVTDMLAMSRDEARKLLTLAYESLAGQ